MPTTPSLSDSVTQVAASPAACRHLLHQLRDAAACRHLLHQLRDAAARGTLDSPRWAGTARAAIELAATLDPRR